MSGSEASSVVSLPSHDDFSEVQVESRGRWSCPSSKSWGTASSNVGDCDHSFELDNTEVNPRSLTYRACVVCKSFHSWKTKRRMRRQVWLSTHLGKLILGPTAIKMIQAG